MNECGVCKSKIKSLLYCNGCFQRAKLVAERRGRVEELKRFKKVLLSLRKDRIQNNHLELDRGLEQLNNRLLELERGEIVNG